MRKLYYVPARHHPLEELGYLTEEAKEILSLFIAEKIEPYWEEIKRKIENANLDYSKLFLYQDSIGVEESKDASDKNVREKLITEFERRQTPNLLLLADLLKKGAILRGTEDKRLLYQEWEEEARLLNLKKVAADIFKNPSRINGELEKIVQEIKRTEQKIADLVQKRDIFIAKRINETLPNGSCGILFIGTAHQVDRELRKFPNLEIIYL